MKIYILIFLLFVTTISCSKHQSQTIIKGNIPNLPNGTIYLFEDDPNNKVDSVKSINGIFEIDHKWNESEPVYIGINHIDNQGVLRLFSFTTNAKYKGVAGWGTSLFLSDPLITINGPLTYNTFVDVQLPPKIKPVTGPPLIAGKQTEAFYNIDGDLFEKIDENVRNIIKEKIIAYPFSFHLLYKINDNKNSFSPEQINGYLKLFKGNITKSDSYKKLLIYNQKKLSTKNITLPLLEDLNGKKSKIFDPNYKKHLVVFWASWCGPCRQEIPLLKKTYMKKNTSIEFISVSIDSDKKAWSKALQQEQMNWKQFIVNENDPNYENIQIAFKLNSAIPYTVLVGNDMKILKSTVGLSSEKDLINFIEAE